MKFQSDNGKVVVIGKRVTLGAAIGSVATIFAELFPEHATAIIASAVPITFIAQVIVANWIGVTTREPT